jgi:Fe-S-cluster containining protein
VARIGRAARPPSARLATILETSRPPPAAAHHPCDTCGVCCRSYLVPLCGHDVWEISRHLHLDPARFAIAWQEEEPGVDGFRLERDGPLFSLVLDKRSWARERSPCIFLMRLPGGHDRCGIYDHRPVSCRAYPMLLVDRRVQMRDDPLCPPGAWPADEPSKPAWRQSVEEAHHRFHVYQVVVSVWNQRLRAVERGHTLDAYYAYVLAAYDRVADLPLDEVRAALHEGVIENGDRDG